jgi:hypothetical protein
MASVLGNSLKASDFTQPASSMPPPPPSLTEQDVSDLEFSARDAAYKRSQTDFTSTPAEVVDPLDEAAKTLWKTGSVTEAIKTYSPPDPNAPKMQELSPMMKRMRDLNEIRNATQSSQGVAMFELKRQDTENFDNQVAKDYQNMDANVFEQVYGAEARNNMMALTLGAADINRRKNTSRGVTEHLQDAGTQIVAGVPSLIGGVGALALKLNSYTPAGYAQDKIAEWVGITEKGGPTFNEQMSTTVAKLGEAGRKFVLQNETQAGQDLRYADEVQAAVDQEQQAKDYRENLSKDGLALAELRDFGHSLTNTGSRLITDPSRGAALVFESVPSLAAGGPAAKVITKGAKLAMGVDAAATAGTRAAVAEAISFPTAIGAMEGADAYGGTTAQIMNMSHDELMVKSPEYQKLISSGFTEEGAKTRIATNAGLKAAAIAAPIGAVTSAAAKTKAFETNLFKPRSLGQTGVNVAKEVPEEAAQGFGGQYATNEGVQQAANPDQRALADTGAATLEGAVAGGGMPLLTHGPVHVTKGAGEVAKAVVDTAVVKPLKMVGDSLVARGEARKAEQAAKAPTSTETLTPEVAAAATAAPVVGQSLRALAEEAAKLPPVGTTETAPKAPASTTEAIPVATTETAPAAETGKETVTGTEPETEAPATPEERETFIKKVESAALLQTEDFEGMPMSVTQRVGDLAQSKGEAPNRFEAMTEVAKVLDDEKATPDEKVAAASFITKIINENKDLFGPESPLPDFLANAPADHKSRQEFDSYAQTLQKLGDNPAIKKAVDWLQKEAVVEEKDFSTIDLNSEEGQQAVDTVVNVATHAPHKLSEATVDSLLQADEKTSKLTPRARQVLRGTQSTLAAERMFSANNRLPEAGLVEAEASELETELEETKGKDEATIARVKEQRQARAAKAKAAKAEASATPPGSTEQSDTAPGIETPGMSAEGSANIDLMSRQINEDGGAKAHQKPIKTHVAEISKAIMSGDTKAIKRGIGHLSMFAKTMRNKVKAIQASINTPKGDRIPYEAFDGKKMQPADGVFETYFNKKAANSAKYAQQVYAEAVALTQLANDYARANPGAGIQPDDEEIQLTLPGQATQSSKAGVPAPTADMGLAANVTGGSSTPGASPATTSETKQVEPPLPGSPTQEAPAATDTTAAAPKSKPPSQKTTDLSTVPDTELQNRLNFFDRQKQRGPLNEWATENESKVKAELAKRRATTPEKTKSGNQLPDVSGQADQTEETDDDLAAYEAMASERSGQEGDAIDQFADEIASIPAMDADTAAKLIDEFKTRTPTQQELVALNKFLDTLSDEEFDKLYERADNNIKISNIKGKAIAGIKQAMDAISKAAGFDVSKLMRAVKAATFKEGPSGGQFNTVGPSLFLTDRVLDRFNNDKFTPDQMNHLLAHELGHAADFHAAGTDADHLFRSSDDPMFQINSPLWNEFKKIKGLASNSVNEPTWSYLDKFAKNREVFPNEFFAELAAFVLNERALAEEHLPLGLKAVEETLSRAAANRQLPRSGTGDTQSTNRGDNKSKSRSKQKVIKDLKDLGPALEETQEPAPEAEPEEDLELTDTLDENATPEQDIKEAFPNLVQKDKNWFHKAFRVGKKLTSRILLLDRPLSKIKALLDNPAALQEFMKGAKIEGYTPKEKDLRAHLKMLGLGDTALKHLNQRLAKALAVKNKQGISVLDQLNSEDPQVIRTRNNRILNLLELDDNGNYKYNPQLIEGALIAAIDWAMNIGDRQVPIDVEDIAKALGIDEAEATKYLAEFKRGLSTEMAVRSLAENIKKLWGLQTNRDTNEDFTKGVPEAVAKEMLMALEHVGLISRGNVSYTVNETAINKKTGEEEIVKVHPRKTGRVWFDERPNHIEGLVTSLDRTATLLRDISLIGGEKEGFAFGKPITDVDDTQLRQRWVKLTNFGKKALLAAQAVPHYLDRTMLNFYQSMDEDGYVALRSGRPYKDGDLEKTHTEMGYNKNDWESIKGRQRGLRTTYRNIQKQIAGMQAYADQEGIDITKVPVFYRHHINRLGRPQMDGASNPQTDKTARHTFVSTRSKLNLSKPGSADFNRFLKTVGQGLGLKTEKLFGDDIAAKVLNQVTEPLGENEQGKFNEAFKATKTWLKSDQTNMPESTYKLFEAAELTDHGIHALISFARYDNAREAGEDLTSFKNYNALEADGKTNGVINALMMAAGKITPKWLRTVAKGGVFFGRLNKTLNQHMLEDSADIYQEVSGLTAYKMNNLGETLSRQDNPAAHAQFQAFRRLLALINVDATINADGEIELKRGIAKSPQTKSVYGAGGDSLAVTVTNDLLNEIYEALSTEVRTGTPAGDILYGKGGSRQFVNDLQALISNKPIYSNKDKKWILLNGVSSSFLNPNPGDITLNPQQFDTFKNNVKAFLIGPMQEAIKFTVNDHVSSVTSLVQQATQVQSIFLVNMMIGDVIASMREKQLDKQKHDWKPGEISLSENDMDRIRKTLLPFSPFIDTGTQRYMMSGGETTDLFDTITTEVNGEPLVIRLPRTYSTTLDKQMETAIYIYGATYAGVRAIPTLNVGSGDGQMMLNMLVDYPEEMKRMLHVFDGLYMPADQIEAYSQLVNQSVYQTWTENGNPIRAVADSFARFMEHNPVDALFPGSVRGQHQNDALHEMAKVISNKKIPSDEDSVNSEDVHKWMEKLVDKLYDTAEALDRRRQIYTEFDLSIDQMASGEAPFVRKGSIETAPNINEDDLAQAMQARLEELEERDRRKPRDRYQGTRKKGPPAPEITVRELGPEYVPTPVEKFLRQYATVDTQTGAQVLTVGKLKNIPDQAGIMTKTLNYLKHNDFLVVFGTPSQLNAWKRANTDHQGDDTFSSDTQGLTDFRNKIIYIANGNQETVTHELIHAATFKKVDLYYQGGHAKGSLSQYDQDAIKRLESLMGEWLNATGPIEDIGQRQLDTDARASVVGHQSTGQPAAALNEFMAYVLAHQDLAKAAEGVTVKSRVSRIIKKALAAIQSLIWGKDIPAPGTDILSNLRFNTDVLLATATPLQLMRDKAGEVMLFQSSAFGQNDRLTTARDGFNRKILAWLNEPYIGPLKPGAAVNPTAARAIETHTQQVNRAAEFSGAELRANDFVKEFALHFGDLNNMQAWSTFEMIQTALFTDLKLNPNTMLRLEEIYDHVISNLKAADFRTTTDPNDVVDAQKAQDKYEAIHGLKIFHTDRYGRSSFMSSFLALSIASDEFRNVLAKMEKPKTEQNTAGGFDAAVENMANSMLDRTSMALSGERSTSSTITDVLDDLTVKMIEQVADQDKHIDVKANNQLSRFENALAEGIQSASQRVSDKANQVAQSSSSRIVRGGAKLIRAAMVAINEEQAEQAQLGLIANINKFEGLHEIRALINDWVGRNKQNMNVWDLINKVRAIAQQTRQRYRKQLPKAIAKKFSRTLSKAEYSAMFRAWGKTDLAALFATYGAAGAFELLTDTRKLTRAIASLEATIQGYEGPRAAKVIQKAKQHANYMNTGNHGAKWLSNSHAIAHLYGENEFQSTLLNSQLEDDVDQLTTLYAMQGTSQEDRDLVKELINNENEGSKFVYHYLVSLRKHELTKVSGRYGTPNYVKGHLPSEKQNEGHLVVVDDRDHADWAKLGYAKVGPYAGSSADRTNRGKSYYFSPVSSKAPFRQGILQTVRYTASGIDPNTGYLSDELTAGRIDNQQVVDLIRRQVSRQRQTNENLRPIYDQQTGETIAYERLLDPTKIVGLDHSTHLGNMIGAWKGRQVEEDFAPALNEELVDELKSDWDKGVRDGKTNQFVNVYASTDPVIMDAVKLIPNYTRDYIKGEFGPNTLMIRRDVLLQTLGDRQASVGDMFTGRTRWKPGVTERFENIAMGLFATAPFKKLFGEDKAYPTLVRAEGLIGDAVIAAKTNIVIKSVVVPVANIMAGFGQLLNRGVPFRDIVTKFPKKVIEINTYIKLRNKEIELEADLEAAKGENKLNEIRKLTSRIQAIKDSYKHMSIYPLIEAGQFASISDGQVTAEDLALAEGKWSEFMTNMIQKIPDNGLRTAAKYGIVDKDTAMFRALGAATQYGDFVMKAILTDHLVAKENKSTDDAIAEASEAFVNYNVLAGRSRDWLERHGLLWFYNYKLRSMKEAAWTLRNRPLRALIMMSAPGLSSIQSVVDSNFMSLAVEGDLPWSIGPGMGLNSWAMNPWANLID